ncbi:MAG: DUF302 domain-containing protein [Deltaproteobacteria bacterium]|nr:DUF302 domain-containing protein [Deltaproteobacteria bacterium]
MPIRSLLAVLMFLIGQAPAAALDVEDFPMAGMVVLETPHAFSELVSRVEQAITDHKMGLVTQASASVGAAGRGVTIPGNRIVGVFRPDFAVRMLAASLPAGVEAPLRFYLVENADGKSALAYRKPSAVFAPYGSDELDRLAEELDPIFSGIAAQAAASR